MDEDNEGGEGVRASGGGTGDGDDLPRLQPSVIETP